MQTKTKKEVSCKSLEPLFYCAKQDNIDLQQLILGVPYQLSYLLNKKERIEWWAWCRIIANARTFYSTSDFENIGSRFVKSGLYPVGLLPAFFIFSSTYLTRLLAKQVSKNTNSMFECITQQIEFVSMNEVKIIVYINDGYDFCYEFFLISKGYWGQLGAQIGHKNFSLNLNLKDSEGIFTATWDDESLSFKVKRVIKWLFNIRMALEDIAQSKEDLMRQYHKLEISKRVLQKQTVQIKTAYEISKSIKQSLDLNKTLEIIISTLISEAKFCSVKIELNKDLNDNKLDIKIESTANENTANSICRDIIINNKILGSILIYPGKEVDFRDAEELLDYVSPLINITIHDALLLREVKNFRDNLELMVKEKTLELENARDNLNKANEQLLISQQQKNLFFTNVSHEFRTPLTLIMGPAKYLLENFNTDKSQELLNLIYRSSNKLNTLVDELLDISKIEIGQMKLRAAPVNLVQIVKEIALSFYSLAERKKIKFLFSPDTERIITYIDQNMFDKILSNLLSNAFKFTPEGGCVSIMIKSQNEHALFETSKPDFNNTIKNENKFVEISIYDTGIGIPRDKLDKIFDRFYQVANIDNNSNNGTGIGLSLTKELVGLHKGIIKVESSEGQGSIFRLFFRLGKEHLSNDEICDEHVNEIPDFEKESDILINKKKDIGLINLEPPDNPTLLIIEDNLDLRSYIKMVLENQYQVMEAENGEEGYTKAFGYIPDLIISDIMMPGMDGFELCNKLKSDERTSHIPVIMLTAKATMEDKISGLETGADDYILKPFEAGELIARIKNLIDQRKRLHEHFRKFGLIDIEEKSISSIDQRFLQNAVDVISKHISDTEFNVELFAESLAVSRSLLVRKIEALFGESPNDLIKRIRLNKSARLIERNFGNISEIALESGFNNPSYFAECFKKQFGVTPSQYHHKE